MLNLDYTLDSPQDRNALVQDILENQLTEDEINDNVLEVLADYLIMCMEKQEKREKKILTENRLITVNKREISFEGLVSQFENGEDGVYNLITESNKQVIFQPKVSITPQDLEEIPLLRQLHDAINMWEARMKTAEGREAYIIKHTLIDLRKDQYIIKNAYRRPLNCTKLTHSKNILPLDGEVSINSEGNIETTGITLLNPTVVSTILCNYHNLCKDAYGHFDNDIWYLMEDFHHIIKIALAPYPLYARLVQYKIAGLQNVDIQTRIQFEFGIKHSVEYLSSLWRNKIPKLIASSAEDEYLNWYYTYQDYGTYKRCSHCGKVKLAHNKYFSKNKTSKDSFYSICKECRNAANQSLKPQAKRRD